MTTTAERLHKAIRQLDCAREETDDQTLRENLRKLSDLTSILCNDVEEGLYDD